MVDNDKRIALYKVAEIRKLLGCSPDRATTYVMALYVEHRVRPFKKLDAYAGKGNNIDDFEEDDYYKPEVG